MNRMTILAFLAGLTASFVGGTLGLITANSTTAVRTEPVFLYGALQHDLTRTYACRCFTSGKEARVTGYALGTDTLIVSPRSSVKGELVALSVTEMRRLDAYIGVPETHYRIRVTTGIQPAWTYMKRGSSAEYAAERNTATSTPESR